MRHLLLLGMMCMLACTRAQEQPQRPTQQPTPSSATPTPPAAQEPTKFELELQQQTRQLVLDGVAARDKKDIKGAIALFEKACDQGARDACRMAGYEFEQPGPRKNLKKARELDAKACGANDALACNNLGTIYAKGTGVPVDWSEAATLFTKACDLGEQFGCDNLKTARWHTAIEASTIWRAYHANEIDADNKFKGKHLFVVGTLHSIDKDLSDAAILHLRSPNQFMPTRAFLDPQDVTKAASLRKGMQVLLACKCEGMTLGSPTLRACRIGDSRDGD